MNDPFALDGDGAMQVEGMDLVGDDQTTPNGTFLCIYAQKLTYGLAFYSEATSTLQLGWTHSKELLQKVKYHFQPNIIFTSSNCPVELFDFLQRDDCFYAFDGVQRLKASSFSFSGGKTRLGNIHIAHLSDLDQQDKFSKISQLIDTENEPMISAAGALIEWLEKRQAAVVGMQTPLMVQQLITLPLEGILVIDAVTYNTLQIFKADHHPSNFGIGKAKEGISLFGLFSRCVSSQGKNLLKQWFLSPTQDISIIESRLDAIEFFLRHENREFRRQLMLILKAIKDIPRILTRITTHQLKSSFIDWKNLYFSISYALKINEICQIAQIDDLEILRRIPTILNEDLFYVRDLILSFIDFGACQEQNRLVIRDGASPPLDEYNQTYRSLDEILNQVAQSERYKCPELSFLSILYFPQLGFQLEIPVDDLTSDAITNMARHLEQDPYYFRYQAKTLF